MEHQGRSNIDGNGIDSQGHQYKVHGENPADIGLKNAQECIGACFDQFLDEWFKKTGGGFEDVCKQLSQLEPNRELWELYCCDSTYCGVWAPVKGKSRSSTLMKSPQSYYSAN